MCALLSSTQLPINSIFTVLFYFESAVVESNNLAQNTFLQCQAGGTEQQVEAAGGGDCPYKSDKKMLTVVRKFFGMKIYWLIAEIVYNLGRHCQAAIFSFADHKDPGDRVQHDVRMASGQWHKQMLERIMGAGTHEFIDRIKCRHLEYSTDLKSMSIRQHQRCMHLFNLQISLAAEISWRKQLCQP